MSLHQQNATDLSSPASSTASTPLYRVFRGLKPTQVVSIPSTNAAWRTTLNELKTIYLEGRWKECESKCLRLVGSCKVCIHTMSPPRKGDETNQAMVLSGFAYHSDILALSDRLLCRDACEEYASVLSSEDEKDRRCSDVV
jgi:hypothetical protein